MQFVRKWKLLKSFSVREQLWKLAFATMALREIQSISEFTTKKHEKFVKSYVIYKKNSSKVSE